MLLLLVGSLVAVPQLVHDRLATEPGVRKSVLDLGKELMQSHGITNIDSELYRDRRW
jgi:hypothetical protein